MAVERSDPVPYNEEIEVPSLSQTSVRSFSGMGKLAPY
ncbi:protein of unknown function [Nitrospina watsonii]|uniref:Uncharacterized protein n=1 Tax=Nitrospina watsonii TaxID=1323948 RepID=A0ABN8VWL4_9BACT|nr:protein of unknown function [Nitrospina watsonii]